MKEAPCLVCSELDWVGADDNFLMQNKVTGTLPKQLLFSLYVIQLQKCANMLLSHIAYRPEQILFNEHVLLALNTRTVAEPWGGTPPLHNPFLLLCVFLPHVHSGACPWQGLSGQTVLLKTIA